MKILFVTDFYHPYSGGVEIHVRAIAAELAGRGHRVAVATLPAPPGERERMTDGAVSVFTIHHSAERFGARFEHGDRPWAPPFPDPVAVRDLRAVVSRFGPDVIHGHDWLARSVLPALAGRRIPLVTSLHYYTRTCAKKTLWRDGAVCAGPRLRDCLRCAGRHYGPARGAVVTLGLRVGARLEDRRTDRWISVSAATAAGNGVTDMGNATVIPNPIPTAVHDAGTGSDLSIGKLPDRPFILFVGDIREEKGVTVLAEAMELLRADHDDDTPLVVVGQRMSEAIALPPGTLELGRLDHSEVQRLWQRATLGVVPSLWPEPFGLVAVEAMAAGCPLVASDVGGLSEVLSGGAGTLVPPGDAVALAGAVAAMLGDPKRRACQIALAETRLSHYSIGRVVDRIEEQYRLAIGRQADDWAGA